MASYSDNGNDRPRPPSPQRVRRADLISPPTDDTGKVGYGSPPKEHQFKPGQSGNPKGRPKGARSTSAIAQEFFLEKVDVRLGPNVRRMTRIQALLQVLTAQALQGNVRALKDCIMLAQRIAVEADVEIKDVAAPTTANDTEILQDFLRRAQADGLLEDQRPPTGKKNRT